LVAVPALAVASAGCGNERNHPTGLAQLGAPVSLVNFTAPSGDVSFGRPSTWSVGGGNLPEIAQMSSGSAVATVYAYPRTDLSLSQAGAEAARQRLLASLRERAPSFEVLSAYSRPKVFRQAETEAFNPLLATIRLGGFPEGPVSGGTKAPG